MAAFQQNLIVSIINNNKPVREFSENGKRICNLPFGSEYKIRLKNKTNRRVLAKVYIDGMDVNGDGSNFLLYSNMTLDLERFVNDLKSGNKFKFISLEEGTKTGQIQDPISEENGLIKVVFYKEKEDNSHRIRTIQDSTFGNPEIFTNHDGTIRISNDDPFIFVNNVFHVSDCNNDDIGLRTTNCSYLMNGATVDGSKSDQEFFDIKEEFETESNPVEINIWLKGIVNKKKDYVVKVINNKLSVFYKGVKMENSKIFILNDNLHIEISDYNIE